MRTDTRCKQFSLFAREARRNCDHPEKVLRFAARTFLGSARAHSQKGAALMGAIPGRSPHPSRYHFEPFEQSGSQPGHSLVVHEHHVTLVRVVVLGAIVESCVRYVQKHRDGLTVAVRPSSPHQSTSGR